MKMNIQKLAENEELLTFFNEHWMIYMTPIFMYLVGTGLGLFLGWLGFVAVGLSSWIGMGIVLLSLLVLLVTQHWFYIALISLELSGWAVTGHRIIDFQFLPYVRHDMMYISIQDINEIEKKQHGLIKNFLHYGEVEITLASSPKPIVFKYLPYPGRFVDLVSRLKKEVR